MGVEGSTEWVPEAAQMRKCNTTRRSDGRGGASARKEGRALSIAGGRHSMGGQQFGRDTILLDMKQFKRVGRFDKESGRLEAQAGIEWPEVIDYLHDAQAGQAKAWAIRAKRSGSPEWLYSMTGPSSRAVSAPCGASCTPPAVWLMACAAPAESVP